MKPVIKKQNHYNIVFMRDDGFARSFRMRCGLVRFCILFPLFMVLLGGGVIAAGVHFGKEYLDLLALTKKQEAEISANRLKLERLAIQESLTSVSSSSVIPRASHEEIGVGSPGVRAQNATAAPQPAEPAADAAPPEPEAPDAPEPVDEPVAGIAEPEAEPTPAASAAASAPPASTTRISSDDSPVRVSGFTGRPIGPQRIRIRYELSTAPSQEGKTISGQARHYAVFANGESAELPLQDNGETRFAIARMKPMEATARLPQGYDTKDIKQINVVIIVDDQGSYNDFFEVTQWRSY